MARPIWIASSVFVLVLFLSTACSAFQSNTAPVFPKTLKRALIHDDSAVEGVVAPLTNYGTPQAIAADKSCGELGWFQTQFAIWPVES